MDEETSQEAWSSYQKISTNYTLEVSLPLCVFAFVTCLPRTNRNFIQRCTSRRLTSALYCDQICLTNISLTVKQFFFQGDSLHWLACALYVACRKSVVPTVDSSGTVEGNCVSLTRLLRAAKLRWDFFFLFKILHRFSFFTNGISCNLLNFASPYSLIQFFSKMKKWLDMSNAAGDFRKKIELLERNFHVSTVIFKKYEPIFLEIFKDPREENTKTQRGRKSR